MSEQHCSETELPHDFEVHIDGLYAAAQGIKELGEGYRSLRWMNGVYSATPAAAASRPALQPDGTVLCDAVEMVLREEVPLDAAERSLCVKDIVEYHIIGRGGLVERLRILLNGEPNDAVVSMTVSMVYESAKEFIALCRKAKRRA